jgi:hypothetical protein
MLQAMESNRLSIDSFLGTEIVKQMATFMGGEVIDTR